MRAKIRSCMKYRLAKMRGLLQIGLSTNNFFHFLFELLFFSKYEKKNSKYEKK